MLEDLRDIVLATPIYLEDVVKIVAAILVGGLVGSEREYRDKAAGFRTMIFICVGATLFTMFSVKLAVDHRDLLPQADPTRIASYIVAGVGFLGAGVIIQDRGRIVGLTTASTIWLVAGLGVGIGGGQYLFVGIALAILLVVLWMFPSVERFIDNLRRRRVYHVAGVFTPQKFTDLEAAFRNCKLVVRDRKRVRQGERMMCEWVVVGRPRNHERMTQKLLADADLDEVRY